MHVMQLKLFTHIWNYLLTVITLLHNYFLSVLSMNILHRLYSILHLCVQERIAASKTLKGRYYDFIGHFFSIYCVYKIFIVSPPTGPIKIVCSYIRDHHMAFSSISTFTVYSEHHIWQSWESR